MNKFHATQHTEIFIEDKNSLAQRLSEDKNGSVRDRYFIVLNNLGNEARQNIRRPTSRQEYDKNQAIVEMTELAIGIIQLHWRQCN
jgi:hypothetical protein